MYLTFKIAIFKPISVDGKEIPVVNIINNHIVVNNECCDLRTIKERYNPETKKLAPSVVDCISNAESILAMHYGKRVVDPTNAKSGALKEYNTLYDFITVDCSGGNDSDPNVKQIKELLCFDGLYLPLSALDVIGYTPHEEV